MKDHNSIEMNDATDVYIRHSLRNWAARQQPPDNKRARILLVAAASASKMSRFVSHEKTTTFFNPQTTLQPSFWAIESMGRSIDWPLEYRLRALRR